MEQERILVVEDEDQISRLLMALLEFKGFQNIQVASNGYEGVKKYKQSRPKIVFMDLEMPIMNGYESSMEIKRYDPSANIVLITANPQSPFARRLIDEGYASGIVPKPFRFEQLMEVIQKSDNPIAQAH